MMCLCKHTVKELIEEFESRTGNYMYSKEVSDQLKQMGCEGFIVKMEMKAKMFQW